MSDLTDYINKVQANGVFQAWPKTPRLNKDIVVTEKIDGTNACIFVPEDFLTDAEVYAQSRKKVIVPGKQTDNFGFAAWVFENRELLRTALGPGRHYGEWYGSGIQSGYGLSNGERRFMLFNAGRWTQQSVTEAGLDAIGIEAPTVMYEGKFDAEMIDLAVTHLRTFGSMHRPYDGKAEGIIVYHTAAQQVFKVMCENDEIPKGLVEA